MNMLFTETLKRSSPLTAMDFKPFLMEGVEHLTEDDIVVDDLHAMLTDFTASIDDLENDDLAECLEAYADDEEEQQSLAEILCTLTERATGSASDASIKQFLSVFGASRKGTITSVGAYGGVPAGSDGTKSFLKSLVVLKNPYLHLSNEKSFTAADVRVFERSKNRYGVPPDADYNATKPSPGDSPYPLANFLQNVSVKAEAYTPVDSIGMNHKMHWRVLDNLTGTYCTKMIEKSQACEIAAGLNNEYALVLAEEIEAGQFYDASHTQHPLHPVCQRHHFAYSHSAHTEKGDVRHTWEHTKHRQHEINSNAGSTHWEHRVGLQRSHTGDGTRELVRHLEGLHLNEWMQVRGSVIIEDSLNQPLNPAYLAAMPKKKDVVQSNYRSPAWKEDGTDARDAKTNLLLLEKGGN